MRLLGELMLPSMSVSGGGNVINVIGGIKQYTPKRTENAYKTSKFRDNGFEQ